MSTGAGFAALGAGNGFVACPFSTSADQSVDIVGRQKSVPFWWLIKSVRIQATLTTVDDSDSKNEESDLGGFGSSAPRDRVCTERDGSPSNWINWDDGGLVGGLSIIGGEDYATDFYAEILLDTQSAFAIVELLSENSGEMEIGLPGTLEKTIQTPYGELYLYSYVDAGPSQNAVLSGVDAEVEFWSVGS